MTTEEVKAKLLASNGKILRVTFVKRTTGETRVMVCRLGVRSHLKGGEAAYSFSEKGLVSVFDMQKKEYRCVPLEGITEVAMDGEVFPVPG